MQVSPSHLLKQILSRILRIQLSQLPQYFFRSLILHLRHHNLNLNDLVPTRPLPSSTGNSLLPQPQLLPRLCPRRNLQLRPTIDRRHLNLRPQRRLRYCNRNSDINIIAVPREHRMRPRLDNQEQVPRGPAIRAGIALARQPDPLSIPSPRLDPKLQLLLLRHHSRAITRRARVLYLARAAAPRALDIELHPPAHLRHLARAMALRTLHTPARRRLPLARRAHLLPLNLQPRHATPHRRPEVHVHLVLQIGPRLRPTRPMPAGEHPAEDIPEASAKSSTRLLLPSPAARKIREIKSAKVERNLLRTASRAILPSATPRKPATRITSPSGSLRRSRIDVVRVEAKLVVDLPLLVVAQNIVRLGDLLELLLRLLVPGVHIRVVLARSLPERLTNLIRSRRLLHAKYAVIIFRLRRHLSCPSSHPSKPLFAALLFRSLAATHPPPQPARKQPAYSSRNQAWSRSTGPNATPYP